MTGTSIHLIDGRRVRPEEILRTAWQLWRSQDGCHVNRYHRLIRTASARSEIETQPRPALEKASALCRHQRIAGNAVSKTFVSQ